MYFGDDKLTWKENYQKWINEIDCLVPYLKKELINMKNDISKIKNNFTNPLSFGTAGMRGIMGPGIHNMNIYTVGQATEGLARFIDNLTENEKEMGVVISYDSRYHSREFAYESARILGYHNIHVYLFDDIRPTPELSFAVRYLKAFVGIMITASHNPKEYNGYKLYGSDGGQITPKDCKEIVTYIHQVDNIFSIPKNDIEYLRRKNLLSIIGMDIDNEYLRNINNISINKKLLEQKGSNISLIYTPLYGTGKIIGLRALKNLKLQNVSIVEKQAIADPEFPDVHYPNPEYHESFANAMILGNKRNADILLATDVDSDRLGVAVLDHDKKYRFLTGNQIAVIMLNYILDNLYKNSELPNNGVIIKSIVSTDLASKVADSYGVKTIEVETGFKYIADKIKQYEYNHKHTFLFGFEESYGFLIKPFVRDKDAIQGITLISEIALYYKEKGKNLLDVLNDIYKSYGYFYEKTISLNINDSNFLNKIDMIMNHCRNMYQKSFANYRVMSIEDLQAQTITFLEDGHTIDVDLPESNVLKYTLEDGSWIAIRPSGTEPKLKIYISTNSSSYDECMKKIDAISNDFLAFIKDDSNKL